jgi:hypothetical protein
MKLSLKQRLTIFDRAYDKATKVKPGGAPSLFPMEEEVLQDALRLDWDLRVAAKKIIREQDRVPTLQEVMVIVKKELREKGRITKKNEEVEWDQEAEHYDYD